MTPRRIGRPLAAAALLAAIAFLVPAAADWLVTKDGTRIETEGPWKVESRLVVFKRPDGTFASMRLSEIDLEASERLTLAMAEAAKRPKEADRVREERREPVARLTEKELPPVESLPRETREEPAGGELERPASPAEDGAEPQPVSVSTWREVTTADDPGLAFVGEISNPTEHVAVGVAVTVTLYDAEDEEIVSTLATLTSDSLPPGKNGAFRATFPGVFYYARADFDVSAELLLTSSAESARTEPPS